MSKTEPYRQQDITREMIQANADTTYAAGVGNMSYAWYWNQACNKVSEDFKHQDLKESARIALTYRKQI